MNSNFIVSDVLERLMKVLNIHSERKLAEKLETSTTTLQNWKSRNNFDIGVIAKFLKPEEFTYVITGNDFLAKELDILQKEKKILELENSLKKIDREIQTDNNDTSALLREIEILRADREWLRSMVEGKLLS